MIIYSELLKRKFDTPEECMVEEAKFTRQLEEMNKNKKEEKAHIKNLVDEACAATEAAMRAANVAAEALLAYGQKYNEQELSFDFSGNFSKAYETTFRQIAIAMSEQSKINRNNSISQAINFQTSCTHTT